MSAKLSILRKLFSKRYWVSISMTDTDKQYNTKPKCPILITFLASN